MDKLAFCRTAGLGSLLLLVLFALLSSALFDDVELALGYQIPLTITCDAGIACAFGLRLIFSRKGASARDAEDTSNAKPACAAESWSDEGGQRVMRAFVAMAAFSCALCGAIMLRSGMLFSADAASMLIGDFLFGALLGLGAMLWWRALARMETAPALTVLAKALAGAAVAFIALSVMPQGVILLIVGLGAPVLCGLCLAVLSIGTDHARQPANDQEAESGPKLRIPRALSVSIVAAMAVSDLLMNLFPVSLYNEPSPLFGPLAGSPTASALGNLTEPALIAAALLLAFCLLFGRMAQTGKMRLPVICSLGFFAVAAGFVTFPYHFPGGAPIGVAEAGRCVIAVFAVAAVRLFLDNSDGDGSNSAVLGLALRAVMGMLIADAVVMALYAMPSFDYFDFRVRTVFGGVGLLTLVALLLVPMPMVYEAVKPAGRRRGQDSPGPSSPEQRLDRFAERYRLSPREKEIMGLLSEGRDVPYIEQQLVLSKSTVKTHTRHIYEKCGVSSRQDLLDLFRE